MTKYALGDTVYIDRGCYGRVDVLAGEVVKITPAGQVTVKLVGGETRFTARGSEVGGDKWWSARLIDKARYDEALTHQAEQQRERAARDAVAAIPTRPTRDGKAEILALIEAARIAVEAL
jgi:hypothetical protein